MTNPTLGTQIASRYAKLGKNIRGYDARVWNFRFLTRARTLATLLRKATFGRATLAIARRIPPQNVLAQVRVRLGGIGITLAKTDSGVAAQNQIEKFKSAAL